MKTGDEEVIERVLNLSLIPAPEKSALVVAKKTREFEEELRTEGDPAGMVVGAGALAIEQVVKEIKTWREAAPDLARRLRERNARIAVLEKQLGEAEAALIESADRLGHKQVIMLKPASYAAIANARTRKGDPRG